MAQRFSNGLFRQYPVVTYGGRFITRFVVEWLSQVVGWPVVDLVGSKWNNVAASGATCESTDYKTLEITSPSYVFSSSDVNSFLTITGFSSPYENRDGIYRISKFIGVVGSVYTIQIDHIAGVHTDGLPVGHTGLSWRLWAGNDTYCPTVNTDVAVLSGQGKNGASLNDGTGTGDSFSLAGTTITFTDAAAKFVDGDVGKSITITGSTTPGNDGTFVITSRISATQITYENASGATEAYAGTWTIRYVYHVAFKAEQWQGSCGIELSPFASWNSGTHTWNDSRYISLNKFGTTYAPERTTYAHIHAEGDLDHFTLIAHIASDNGTNFTWAIMSCGEMDVFYPEFDPRPCWSFFGNDSIYQGYEAYYSPFFGWGSANGHYNYYFGLKALGADNVTTYTFYLMMPHMPSTTNWNLITLFRRRLSGYSRKFYKIPLTAECRTVNNHELRGNLRQIWGCNNTLYNGYPLGASGEFIHFAGGVLIPWNGAASNTWKSGRSTGVG